eukprot:scaffold23789_cov142-Isochrysis_galbana.AAC.3
MNKTHRWHAARPQERQERDRHPPQSLPNPTLPGRPAPSTRAPGTRRASAVGDKAGAPATPARRVPTLPP